MRNADLGVRMEGGDTSLMGKMVEKNWLGRKTGKGFFMYPPKPKKEAKKELNPEMLSMLKGALKEKGITQPSKLSVEDIQMRLISRFVNEAAFCLQDEIIRAPADGKNFTSTKHDTLMCIHNYLVFHSPLMINPKLFSYTEGDIGAVFGIGFPPFLGGPFRMLDLKGTSQFVSRMERYRDQYGMQFEPAQILKDYATSGKKFHE